MNFRLIDYEETDDVVECVVEVNGHIDTIGIPKDRFLIRASNNFPEGILDWYDVCQPSVFGSTQIETTVFPDYDNCMSPPFTTRKDVIAELEKIGLR